MKPTSFPEANLTLQCPEADSECMDLKVFARGNMVFSRWAFEPEELEELMETATVWLWIHSDSARPIAAVNPCAPFVQKKPVVIGVKQSAPKPPKIPATRHVGAWLVDGYTIYKFQFSGVALQEAKKTGALWVAIIHEFYPPISIGTSYPFSAPEEELALMTVQLPLRG